MVDSSYTYIKGVPIDVGVEGAHNLIKESGEPVNDGGESPFVFERGTGLGGGIEFNVDMSAANEITYAQDEEGNDQIFEAGTYQLSVSGNGWSHSGGGVDTSNLVCDVDTSEVGGTLDFYAPCNRVEALGGADDTYSLVTDFDGDGTDEVLMGPALVYPGAGRTLNTPEGDVDAIEQTTVFTDKTLEVPSSGNGTITLTSSGKIGVYNMDEPGTYGDNSAEVTYTLVA